MSRYQTPRVYYERADAGPPGIATLRTDIAGFVGIASRGPLDTPVPLESWRQFKAHFGGFYGSGYLAYAVRSFFENGGRRCWAVRVASRDPNGGARPAELILSNLFGTPVWRLVASSSGTWGNLLTVQVKETHRGQTATIPAASTPNASTVHTVSGFIRGTLVRLTQGTFEDWRVVSDIDPDNSQLIWWNDIPERHLPYDQPLSGFDPDVSIIVSSVEYTIVVQDDGRPAALFENLSLIPEHPNYAPIVLAPPLYEVQSSNGTRGLPAAPRPILCEGLLSAEELTASLAPLAVSDTGFVPLESGTDGLSILTSYDFVGEPFSPLDSDETRLEKRRGLQSLDLVDEIAIVAIPDIHIQPVLPPLNDPIPCTPDPCLPGVPPPVVPPPVQQTELPPVFSDADIYTVQAALILHCESRHDRIAVVDPPYKASRQDALGISAVRAWRSRFDSAFGALYYPWMTVVDPLQIPNAPTRDIPPSGFVAGQYAKSDLEIGVHKAPANSALVWVQNTTADLDDERHGILNSLGINAIRPLSGRGIRIMGARTMSSDTSWRFVNVRRLLMMIEKAIYLATQWAVFEPNDIYTQAKVRLSISSFLISLWQRGALVGTSPREAFFVKCDMENNPASERENGRMLAEVGVAPTQPFEFVVLRVGFTGNEIEIEEAPKGGR